MDTQIISGIGAKGLFLSTLEIPWSRFPDRFGGMMLDKQKYMEEFDKRCLGMDEAKEMLAYFIDLQNKPCALCGNESEAIMGIETINYESLNEKYGDDEFFIQLCNNCLNDERSVPIIIKQLEDQPHMN